MYVKIIASQRWDVFETQCIKYAYRAFDRQTIRVVARSSRHTIDTSYGRPM